MMMRLPPVNTMPVRALGMGMLCTLLLAGCAANPTGGANFVLMSERSEIEKGKELHEEVMRESVIYDNPAVQEYVNRIGQKMAQVSHRSNLEYTFTVIDSPEINAYALPAGYVYINRGLLLHLNSEAQLAAVLGHEIGHITARHAVRQQTAARTARAASTAVQVATVLTTGVGLGDTPDILGGALISGYGRDMELEADSLGAEYLRRAGYDPNAMIEVISVLKSHEDFMKRVANRGPTYHGLFATHPRNDTRLQEAVKNAGTLQESERAEIDPNDFMRHMNGLTVGPSTRVATGPGRNRYYQNLLNYTLVFPDGWSTEETPTTVTALAPDKSVSFKVEAMRLQEMKEPRLFLRENLKIPELQSSEPLSQFGLSGYTGINPSTQERVAVLYYGPRAYVMTGKVLGEGAGANTDALLLDSIRSFRPIAAQEQAMANPPRLAFVQHDGRATYADLARISRLGQHGEETLRLWNGHYPRGEPKAGDWIKIVQH